MEQQDKRLAEPLRSESIKWACDVLGLDSQVCEESRKSASRHTVGAFFASLKSNGFFVESDKIEAVEMALENPVANAPQFLKHLSQQGFQRLDGVVEWFASELGGMHGPSLLNALEGRLENLNLQGCSKEVHSYAKRIWQSGQAVDRKVLDANPAVIKILQALFHVSTVRQSQRCRVRSQWVKKLRSEFSVDELGKAKQIAQRTAVVPDGRFHRPFLFMLTRKVAGLDERWLPPPVNSRRTASVQGRHFRQLSTKGSGGGSYLGWVIFLAVFFGLVSSCIRNLSNSSSNSKPNRNWQSNPTWKQNWELNPNWRPGESKWQPIQNSEQENETMPESFDSELFKEIDPDRNLNPFSEGIPNTDVDENRLRGDR